MYFPYSTFKGFRCTDVHIVLSGLPSLTLDITPFLNQSWNYREIEWTGLLNNYKLLECGARQVQREEKIVFYADKTKLYHGIHVCA